MSSDYKVKLVRAASVGFTVEQVVFEVTPDFSESRAVNYKTIDPVHAPGQIYAYERTSSRTFDIQGKFISRSAAEASQTIFNLQLLRTWAMPVFGQPGTQPGEDVLGAPPAILFLSAYANDKAPPSPRNIPDTNIPAYGKNIYNVPVVITQLTIPYPVDVDYIPSTENIPVPTIMTVSVNLAETHSPKKLSSFNLQKFKQGILDYF